MAGKVKDTAGMTNQAAADMALFAESAADEIEVDMAAAQAFKSGVDGQIRALNEAIQTLSGKDNARLREAMSEEASGLNKTDEYIDAVRVIKGQAPKHGHFVKGGSVHQVAEADTKNEVDEKTEPTEEAKASVEPVSAAKALVASGAESGSPAGAPQDEEVMELHILWAISGEPVVPPLSAPLSWSVLRLCYEIGHKTGIPPIEQRLLAHMRSLAFDEVLGTALAGDGESRTLSLIRMSVPNKYKAFAAGGLHTAAIQADGSPRCWGADGFGQSTVPQDLGPVTAVALGWKHTCALKRDGTVACWGRDVDGESTVPPGLGEVTAVAAGDFHTCAIQRDGSLACWGDDAEGQCTAPPDLGAVLAVAAGDLHTCAIKADGAVACWGCNRYDQCAVPEDLGEAVAVVAGEKHTCAVRRDGRLVCWGRKKEGQCTPPADLGPVLAVAAGGGHTCAVRADGSVACWGCNKFGQCTPPPDLGPVLTVAAGTFHSCAVKADGALVCWGARGRHDHGQCAVPAHLVAVAAPSV